MRWWFAAALVLAVVVCPARAHACSCGSFDPVTAESCRGAKRAFAGVVVDYHWPDPVSRYFMKRSYDAVGVELVVDRVWKGAVPQRLFTTTGMGGGDCGIDPPVGTRFVVCDDEDDAAPPSYKFCDRPAFYAPEIEAALGPWDAPQPWHTVRVWMALLVGAGVVIVSIALRRR